MLVVVETGGMWNVKNVECELVLVGVIVNMLLCERP